MFNIATEELGRIELVSAVISALHAGGAKPVPPKPSNLRNAYKAADLDAFPSIRAAYD